MPTSASDDDYSPREIVRMLTRLEQSLTELRHEVSTLGFVRQDVWSVEREAIHERIETVRLVAESDTADVRVALASTQENLRWLARALVGVVLTAVVTGLLAAAGVGP